MVDRGPVPVEHLGQCDSCWMHLIRGGGNRDFIAAYQRFAGAREIDGISSVRVVHPTYQTTPEYRIGASDLRQSISAALTCLSP